MRKNIEIVNTILDTLLEILPKDDPRRKMYPKI